MNETDKEFAYRIRQGLDEGLDSLPEGTRLALHRARQRALERMPEAVVVPVWVPALRLAGDDGSTGHPWLRGLGLAAPLFALVVGLVGISQFQQERTVAEVADLDFAVLMDDTPIATYAHRGYGEVLRDPAATL
jgi:hypothetical protein